MNVREAMNQRVTADQHATPTAPPDTWTLSPSPTPGYQTPGNPAPNPGGPGFQPQMGEAQSAARSRVIDQVLNIARGNGGEPADNG